MNKAAKYILSGVGAAVILTIGAGAYWYWERVSFASPLPKTAQGVAFEQLLPSEASLVFSYSPSDALERARFEKLWATVLQDKKDAILPFFATKSSFPLTLDDLLIFFGDDFRFLAGFIPMEGETEPVVYTFISVQDPAKARAFFTERMTEATLGTPPPILRDTEDEWMAVSNDNTTVIGLVKDTAFFTNAGTEAAQKIFQRASSPFPSSFLHTSEFRAAAKSFQTPLSGYLYLNMNGKVTFPMASASADVLMDMGAFQFTASSFHAEEGGLRFDSISKIDRSKAKDSTWASLVAPYEAHLYKTFPSSALIAYFEAHGFDGILLTELQLFSQAFGMTKEDALAKFTASTGLDFETDVRPVLSRGFAMGWSETGSIMPGFSLIFDAIGAPDKAKLLVEKLDGAAAMLSGMANIGVKTEDGSPFFERVSLASELPAGGVVKIHFQKLPREEANIPLFDALTKPLEFSYGLTEDHRLFLSFVPDFVTQLKAAASAGMTPENTPVFKKLKALAAGQPMGSIGMFDTTVFWQYGSHIMKMFEQFEEIDGATMDEGAQIFLEAMKKYLSPLKSFVQVGASDGETVTGTAFLEIQ